MLEKEPLGNGLVRVTFRVSNHLVADHIALVGEFNGWAQYRHLLQQTHDDDWHITLDLERGARTAFDTWWTVVNGWPTITPTAMSSMPTGASTVWSLLSIATVLLTCPFAFAIQKLSHAGLATCHAEREPSEAFPFRATRSIPFRATPKHPVPRNTKHPVPRNTNEILRRYAPQKLSHRRADMSC